MFTAQSQVELGCPHVERTGSAKSVVRINISSVTHYTPGDGVMTNEGKNALWCGSIYSMCRFGV